MDLRRTMQLIVEQQVQLTASVQKHNQHIDGPNGEIGALTGLVGRLGQAKILLVDQMQGREARLASLETKTTQLLERKNRFIQGREGNERNP
jgi:hypothetical protein